MREKGVNKDTLVTNAFSILLSQEIGDGGEGFVWP